MKLKCPSVGWGMGRQNVIIDTMKYYSAVKIHDICLTSRVNVKNAR